jgi:Ig domain of plant-specific actin-binding protein
MSQLFRHRPSPPFRFPILVTLAAAVVAVLALLAGSGTASSSAVPANTSPPAISGTAREGETLTATTGAWSGIEPISYTFQWHRCSSSVSDCSAIAGATNTTYTLTSQDVGKRLVVSVQATNPDGSAAAQSSATDVVAPKADAPTNTAPPTISGTPVQGQTLTASTGSWSGTKPLTFAYQWRRCNKNGGSCSSISGATQRRYRLTSADVGNTVRVRVTATNTAGSATATSVPTAVIKKPAGPPPPPPKPATGCPPGNGPVSVSKVTAPARLTVDRTDVTPDPLRRFTRSIVARFHVSDSCGQSVGGALVYVTAVPFNQFTIPAEQPTDANGNVTLQMNRLSGYPAARHQQLLVLFVRARKPGDPLLGGISTRRLVSTGVELNR